MQVLINTGAMGLTVFAADKFYSWVVKIAGD